MIKAKTMKYGAAITTGTIAATGTYINSLSNLGTNYMSQVVRLPGGYTVKMGLVALLVVGYAVGTVLTAKGKTN